VQEYKDMCKGLFLDNPLHVILNNSKLAYRIYVILIANKELIKKMCKGKQVGLLSCALNSLILRNMRSASRRYHEKNLISVELLVSRWHWRECEVVWGPRIGGTQGLPLTATRGGRRKDVAGGRMLCCHMSRLFLSGVVSSCSPAFSHVAD
jgi:hypothetical protein